MNIIKYQFQGVYEYVSNPPTLLPYSSHKELDNNKKGTVEDRRTDTDVWQQNKSLLLC